MLSSKNQADLIGRFIDGELKGAALEKFRKELDTNPALQAELRLQQKVNDALKEKEILHFRQQLNEIHKQVVPAAGTGWWKKLYGSKITV